MLNGKLNFHQFKKHLNTKRSFSFFSFKRFSSQVYGNIVKQSEDISMCRSELMVPFHSHNYIIYFKPEETLEEISKRIETSHIKIQKVVFTNLNKSKVIDSTTKIDTILETPFELVINNNDKIKYLPPLNLLAQRRLGFTLNNGSINNNFNFFLYNYLTCPKVKKLGLEKYKIEINNLLNEYGKIYEDLLEEQKIIFDLIEERVGKSTKRGSYQLMLLFFVHWVVFYLLIYQWYGWDEIEPFTYIVGNIYWIFGLIFYIFAKNRMDISFFTSNFYRNFLFKKQCKRLSFNFQEKEFIESYLEKLKVLRSSVNNNI